MLTCVTGVSGSGKSTLVNEVLFKAVANRLHRARQRPGAHTAVLGLDALDKIIQVDQSPIGRTPRSNPATYTGLFDVIRDLFSKTQEARARGYKPGRFSFNVKGGRCEVCRGDGQIKIEMHFLPDVYVPCEQCHGKRYNKETLDIRFKGKTIADVLDMPVEEAVVFFEHIPKIRRRLETLNAVGLGYIRLGQPATTLSGGEAQRVKLATELSKVATGSTLYILDEPTTGLHFADVERLLDVLQRLVDQGNSVVVIEHNLDVIKTADRIIDMGPEGGEDGGEVIATGTPEEVAGTPGSYTGEFLQALVEPAAPKARRGTGKRKRRVADAGMSATYREIAAARAARVARVLRVDQRRRARATTSSACCPTAAPTSCGSTARASSWPARPRARCSWRSRPGPPRWACASAPARRAPRSASPRTSCATARWRSRTSGARRPRAGRAPGGGAAGASRLALLAAAVARRLDGARDARLAGHARERPAGPRRAGGRGEPRRSPSPIATCAGASTTRSAMAPRRCSACCACAASWPSPRPARAPTSPGSPPRRATPTSRTSRASARSWRACRRRRCWRRGRRPDARRRRRSRNGAARPGDELLGDAQRLAELDVLHVVVLLAGRRGGGQRRQARRGAGRTSARRSSR